MIENARLETDERVLPESVDNRHRPVINLSTETYFYFCVSSMVPLFVIFLFTRRRSFAEYWKHFVARFNDVHASGYNSAGSTRIRMKFGVRRVYCLELALTDFGRDPRRSESGRANGIFVFLSGK